ncbi:hypothetical protein H2200_005217 [Cladophialophora chaetospira]|uniref:DUF1772-domain-containing protein n=1 Tax=Cladophialophora chaetospira TaxID=386627 RepID=A0AA39CJE8_9EURO|nr:hypothetical protein H2200_005217 [Cladophialophora chaetospira]
MDSLAVAKVLGLTSSGIFAGTYFIPIRYTWALSHAAVPAILFAPEELQAKQWRYQYLMGFYVSCRTLEIGETRTNAGLMCLRHGKISRPMCIVNGLSFGYLAYHSPESSLIRTLYILAALTSASGVPYALTLLRRTNGALSRKANRFAGPGPKNGQIVALTYAFNEGRSIERDQRMGTAETVERWSWHNYIRTWVLVLGTMVGALAVALDGK